jgi:hypothetical protein
MYIMLKDHVQVLRIMLEICRKYHISLNIKKCIFGTPFGILLDHIVRKQGLLVYPSKIAVIVNLPPPKSMRQLRETLGLKGYYNFFYKRVCIDHCTSGETIKEVYQISVE